MNEEFEVQRPLVWRDPKIVFSTETNEVFILIGDVIQAKFTNMDELRSFSNRLYNAADVLGWIGK
jgi:hypothetical protein